MNEQPFVQWLTSPVPWWAFLVIGALAFWYVQTNIISGINQVLDWTRNEFEKIRREKIRRKKADDAWYGYDDDGPSYPYRNQ